MEIHLSQVEAEPLCDHVSPELTRPPVEYLDGYERLVIVSPGKEGEEYKDQDRALTLIVEDGRSPMRLMAIVCDGVFQSPNSAEAAEYVSTSLNRLHGENGVREVVNGLLERREEVVGSPLSVDRDASPVLKAMLEDIVKEKRTHSFQTTFISVALDRAEGPSSSRLRVRALGCGDSCVFIFTDEGKLLYDSHGLADEDDPIEHLTTVTAVLPDNFDETGSKILDHSQSYADEIQVLLCSDGFYDSFTTFNDMFFWLNTNLGRLKLEDQKSEVMADLHFTLSRKRGDDDISFIWLRPRNHPSNLIGDITDQPRTNSPIPDDTQRDSPMNRSFLNKLWLLARSFGIYPSKEKSA